MLTIVNKKIFEGRGKKRGGYPQGPVQSNWGGTRRVGRWATKKS